jgi:hypothetical protein
MQSSKSTKGGTTDERTLIYNIGRFFHLNRKVRICHSYKETNSCADVLANMEGEFIM